MITICRLSASSRPAFAPSWGEIRSGGWRVAPDCYLSSSYRLSDFLWSFCFDFNPPLADDLTHVRGVRENRRSAWYCKGFSHGCLPLCLARLSPLLPVASLQSPVVGSWSWQHDVEESYSLDDCPDWLASSDLRMSIKGSFKHCQLETWRISD